MSNLLQNSAGLPLVVAGLLVMVYPQGFLNILNKAAGEVLRIGQGLDGVHKDRRFGDPADALEPITAPEHVVRFSGFAIAVFAIGSLLGLA